jgi:thioredoxin 1
MTDRPKKRGVDLNDACEFTELEDGRIRARFTLFGIDGEGATPDEAVQALIPTLQQHLEDSEIAREKWDEWVPAHIVEVEMTDEEIEQQQQIDDLVERGKTIGKTFRALDGSEFAGFVSSPVPVIVDFWAEWCGPCHMLAPVLKEVTDELQIAVAKVNIDENPDIWEEIPSGGIPTLAVYKNGERRGIVVGAGRSPDELKAELAPFLS